MIGLEEHQHRMTTQVFSVGSRVRVISYSPFRGFKGTVRTVRCILPLEEQFCFYQITLEGASNQEPIWFEFDDVELMTPHERG